MDWRAGRKGWPQHRHWLHWWVPSWSVWKQWAEPRAAAVLTNNPSKVWNELGPGFFQAGPAAWLEMSTAAAQLRQDREPSGPHRRWTAKCVEDKIPVSQGNTSEQSSLLSSTILWSSDQLWFYWKKNINLGSSSWDVTGNMLSQSSSLLTDEAWLSIWHSKSLDMKEQEARNEY